MAKLIGYLQGNRASVSRLSHDVINARLETWRGAISVRLSADGEYAVYIGQKGNPTQEIARGNIDTR